jgi:hypothetical protein
MRISEAISEQKPLAVKFGASVLNIVYAPPSYTVAEMEEAQADKTPARLIAMLQQIVTSWDLTDNDEVPIDLRDAEALRTKVGINIIGAIIKAVREDNQPGEE